MFNNIKKSISKYFSKSRISDESNIIDKNNIIPDDELISVQYEEDNENDCIYIPPNTLLKMVFISNKNNKGGNNINHNFYCKNTTQNLKHIINSNDTTQKDDYENYIISKGWKPPKQHGLNNCNKIIPSYYFSENNITNGVLDISYLFIIKDDIRNSRKLNNYQIEYIYNLQEQHKDAIIHELLRQSESNINFIELIKSNPNSIVSRMSRNSFELSNKYLSNNDLIQELLKQTT